jgi:hypothetical protein
MEANTTFTPLSEAIEQIKYLDSQLPFDIVKTNLNAEMTESFLLSFPFPVWIKESINLQVIFINRACEQQYNIKASDFLTHISQLPAVAAIMKASEARDREVIETRKTTQYMQRIPRLDGKVFDAHIIKFPIIRDNDVIGLGVMVVNTIEIILS